jgi:hypothetical protein
MNPGANTPNVSWGIVQSGLPEATLPPCVQRAANELEQ